MGSTPRLRPQFLGAVPRILTIPNRFETASNKVIGTISGQGTKGERIGTAHIELTVNQLINQRMCKKHHVRWPRLGAQLMLHVGAAHLNGCLERYCGLPKPVVQ